MFTIQKEGKKALQKVEKRHTIQPLAKWIQSVHYEFSQHMFQNACVRRRGIFDVKMTGLTSDLKQISHRSLRFILPTFIVYFCRPSIIFGDGNMWLQSKTILGNFQCTQLLISILPPKEACQRMLTIDNFLTTMITIQIVLMNVN